MHPPTPALDDLLEALDHRIRAVGEDAAPGGDLPGSGLCDLIDTLSARIRSIDAGYRRCRHRLALLPAGCLCTGPDGVILEANRAAGALLGPAPDRLRGLSLPAHLHPGSLSAFRSAVAALERGDEVPVQEFLLARPDGSTLPVGAAVAVVRDGAIEHLWILSDVSGQKMIEEARRRSEERYRELTGNISDAFLALDQEDRIISWNRVAANLSGHPGEEVIGKSIYDVYPELRTEEVVGFFREVRETGRPGMSECRFHVGGRDHAFEVRAVPTREGISIYIRDITDRRNAEEALRKSEERYRAIVENQTEMIYRRLPDGTITFANDAYCRSIGIPPGDLVGRRYAPAIPADDQARIQKSLHSLTPAHPVLAVEHRVVMPDGEIRWQQWTHMAFFDETGSLVEYQSVGRDTSAARMAEEALRLANKKLNLLSDVTRHDTLNRLNVLTGYIDLSREETKDPDLQEYYRKEEEVIREIRRYMVFTGEYREIGVAAPIWQDVGRIAREAAAGLDMGEVAVEVQVADIEVYADPLIVQVFANLIDNSLRHGGGVARIRISARESDRGVTIIYEDDGIGIPLAEKEDIFKRGFGLFLAREILSITDLSLRETGRPGEGARFEIGVPRGYYRFTGPGQAP